MDQDTERPRPHGFASCKTFVAVAGARNKQKRIIEHELNKNEAQLVEVGSRRIEPKRCCRSRWFRRGGHPIIVASLHSRVDPQIVWISVIISSPVVS
jgi:hypothetical protein